MHRELSDRTRWVDESGWYGFAGARRQTPGDVRAIANQTIQQITDIFRKIRQSLRAAGCLHCKRTEKPKTVFRLVSDSLQGLG